MMSESWVDGFVRSEYAAQRVEALWWDCADARRRVCAVLRDLDIADPRTVGASDLMALSRALYDLDGEYPEAADAALTATARLMGRCVRDGGGTRADAARIARSFPSEARRHVILGFSGPADISERQSV